MTKSLAARSEVDERFTWDAESVFPDHSGWELAVDTILSSLPDLEEFKGRLGDSPETLADWFEANERAHRLMAKVMVYSTMSYSVDVADQDAAARADRARSVAAQLGAAASFAVPEMLEIGIPKLREWVASSPRLAHLDHYFDRLEKLQKRIRSAEVEELLTQVSDPLASALAVHSVLANTDLKFAPAVGSDGELHEVAQGTIGALMTNADREVRRTAFESYADEHLRMQHAMAASLAGGVKRDVFFARARGYASSLEAALEPSHIPVEVFHNVVRTFRDNVGTWHRYWRIRRHALGLEVLKPYDTRAQLGAELLQVPYQEAVEWIAQGVAPLGEDYVEVMRRGALEERWVDVYPNKGKRMGAFSTGAMDTRPFIFMSYNDDIYSMSTLAHELGHSMHSYHARRTQPYVYSNYGLFQAEVASNMHQALTRRHLLATKTDPAFQVAVIEEAMSNFYRYFFIMPSLARLELEIHERVERGGALTADYLNNLMADLMVEVYGSEIDVSERDRERIGSTWAQFHTHLYSNFYVYQYATGIAAADHLVERVAAGDAKAVASYRAFLASAGSMYPLDGLRMAGVDMTSPGPVEAAFATLASMVDRLEKLTTPTRS
ncbi:MAG: oligoendopeptidase F [Chloroflexi bacterium]|nr:MAG: oligoendopeptidase F [Chloroflexota bacterium]TMF79119.1 MAG: oligoendopeptidase F [Chloroflexota bacterium]TMF91423.1 MAG: oligoendopeptidase F [Chloroflexota bacterium]